MNQINKSRGKQVLPRQLEERGQRADVCLRRQRQCRRGTALSQAKWQQWRCTGPLHLRRKTGEGKREEKMGWSCGLYITLSRQPDATDLYCAIRWRDREGPIVTHTGWVIVLCHRGDSCRASACGVI
jgi:hypothetical protein